MTAKIGKSYLYAIPVPDIVSLGSYADRLQHEAETEGRSLPAPIRLQIGEPNFSTPEHIRQAAIECTAHDTLTYGPAAGWPWLRELIADKIARIDGYIVQPENVAVTVGGTGALITAMQATLEAGDEVLLSDPCWPIYAPQLQIVGAVGVPYPLDPTRDWQPDLAELERLVTPRTKMLLINTPGNPTGAVFPCETIAALWEFACRHDLYLLSDECYDQLVFDGQHVSPASLLSPAEFESGRFIGVYTFSKTYAMTGWRIGYTIASKKLTKTIVDVLNAALTSISMPIQRAAAAAITGPQDCVTKMRESYRANRDLVVQILKEYHRYLYTPHGAFYTMIDVRGPREERRGRQFALDLIREHNITVTPGIGFGKVSADYVRVSLAASSEDLARGVRTICEFANQE